MKSKFGFIVLASYGDIWEGRDVAPNVKVKITVQQDMKVPYYPEGEKEL